MTTIDLSADVGESFGSHRMGDDERLLGALSSANIACGFHSGDPVTMERTVRLCLDQGVAIGAHPGFRGPRRVRPPHHRDVPRRGARRRPLPARRPARLRGRGGRPARARVAARPARQPDHHRRGVRRGRAGRGRGLRSRARGRRAAGPDPRPGRRAWPAHRPPGLPRPGLPARRRPGVAARARCRAARPRRDHRARRDDGAQGRGRPPPTAWRSRCECDSILLHGDNAASVDAALQVRRALEDAGLEIAARL